MPFASFCLKLFERVYAPLTAGLLKPFPGDRKFADEKPKCPMQMHFGEKDEGIPMDVVEAIKKKQAQAEIYTYPDAPHGFYCDERASYRKEAGDLAWKRTQEFLTKHMK